MRGLNALVHTAELCQFVQCHWCRSNSLPHFHQRMEPLNDILWKANATARKRKRVLWRILRYTNCLGARSLTGDTQYLRKSENRSPTSIPKRGTYHGRIHWHIWRALSRNCYVNKQEMEWDNGQNKKSWTVSFPCWTLQRLVEQPEHLRERAPFIHTNIR